MMLSEEDINRIIEMSWEDRTPFDAIFKQFELREDQVKKLMKKELKFSSYKLWRDRVEACKTKHQKNVIMKYQDLNVVFNVKLAIIKFLSVRIFYQR